MTWSVQDTQGWITSCLRTWLKSDRLSRAVNISGGIDMLLRSLIVLCISVWSPLFTRYR
jgi:hypothetical protein